MAGIQSADRFLHGAPCTHASPLRFYYYCAHLAGNKAEGRRVMVAEAASVADDGAALQYTCTRNMASTFPAMRCDWAAKRPRPAAAVDGSIAACCVVQRCAGELQCVVARSVPPGAGALKEGQASSSVTTAPGRGDASIGAYRLPGGARGMYRDLYPRQTGKRLRMAIAGGRVWASGSEQAASCLGRYRYRPLSLLANMFQSIACCPGRGRLGGPPSRTPPSLRLGPRTVAHCPPPPPVRRRIASMIRMVVLPASGRAQGGRASAVPSGSRKKKGPANKRFIPAASPACLVRLCTDTCLAQEVGMRGLASWI